MYKRPMTHKLIRTKCCLILLKLDFFCLNITQQITSMRQPKGFYKHNINYYIYLLNASKTISPRQNLEEI